MKTHLTPHAPRAARLGLSLAAVAAGATLLAQQPATDPFAEPVAAAASPRPESATNDLAARPPEVAPAAIPEIGPAVPAHAAPSAGAPARPALEPTAPVPLPVGLPETPRAPGRPPVAIRPAQAVAPGASNGGATSATGRGLKRKAKGPKLADVLVEGELTADPTGRIDELEAVLTEFDSQREEAAQAVFHLGEAYRRLGRVEQARVQFARILREFVDFPELVRLSHQQLSQQASVTEAPVPVGKSLPPPTAEERSLLEEELALLMTQLGRIEANVKAGVTSESALFPLQRDMLHIKQQLARLARDERPTGPAAVPPRARKF